MSDIVSDIRNHLLTMAPHQRERLTAWQLRVAADEIERLRDAIRRLADQDATLSVCDGAVTVTMDATLTDAERSAIRRAAAVAREFHDVRLEAVLTGLLERTQPTQTTPAVCSVPERDTIADAPPPDPEQDNARLRRPYYVDPPSGWRYGFPKLYDPAQDGDLTEWLVAQGYPKHLADQNLPCTFTAATDSE